MAGVADPAPGFKHIPLVNKELYDYTHYSSRGYTEELYDG